MSAAPLVLLLLAAPESAKPALAAFREGQYAKAAHVLWMKASALAKNRDYYLYFLGESQFYVGDYGKAGATFAELGKARDSRFAALAPWRAADCLWMAEKRQEAVATYRKIVGNKAGDAALARFRIALVQAEAAQGKGPSEAAAAARAFLQIHVEYPAHPLAAEAARRAAQLAPPETPHGEPSPQERLRRAATLAKGRKWQQAESELLLLPAALPAELAAERDLAMGMAKYHARRDYAGAAQLLLGVAPRLPADQAAFAAFHGARALSRIDRDDEAIASYRAVVAKYPNASWAAEAQFRAGWLEINRGHFRAALPDLRATLGRYPKSRFADDAAWYLALSYHLLGESAQALAAIAHYEQIARRLGEDARLRALYWRARILAQAGQGNEAKAVLHECAARAPFHYYALLARARLSELSEPLPPWPSPSRGALPPFLPDPVHSRAAELRRSGLDVEAGAELERGESGIIKRHGKAKAVPFLLATYPRLLAFHRAYKLAETSGESVLGDTRLVWLASYPRAFAAAVESHGQAMGVPELFIYAIMRKESTYHPYAVSPADARGLLQLIPNTAAEVAKHLDIVTYPDELFDPDTNIRLGTAYLGGLLRRFRGQEALAAGAYNAGARAMMRWCDQWSGRPLDEFVELVTYDQAREYIKRVLGVYARYRYLYDQPLELPLTVNTQYLKDGFDF